MDEQFSDCLAVAPFGLCLIRSLENGALVPVSPRHVIAKRNIGIMGDAKVFSIEPNEKSGYVWPDEDTLEHYNRN